jgi:hypothetical protein
MEASEQGKVPHSKRPAFWVIVVISVMAVVVIIRMMGGLDGQSESCRPPES